MLLISDQTRWECRISETVELCSAASQARLSLVRAISADARKQIGVSYRGTQNDFQGEATVVKNGCSWARRVAARTERKTVPQLPRRG